MGVGSVFFFFHSCLFVCVAGGGKLPALDLPWCPFFSIVCVLVTGLILPTNRVLEREEDMEMMEIETMEMMMMEMI